MKNILTKLTVLGAAALLSASCIEEMEPTGYLTEAKKNEIAKEAPEKVFTASLAGMYSNLQLFTDWGDHNYFGLKSFEYLSSLMGNDVCMTGRFGMSLYHYLLDYGEQSYRPTRLRWEEYYTAIADANNIIKSLGYEPETDSGKSMLAQALAFRGQAYMQLTYIYQFSNYVGVEGTKWGKGKKYDWSEEPCVPLLLEDSEGVQPRASLKEINAQISKDLELSYKLFKEIGAIKTSLPTDFDGTVVAHYLARHSMVLNKWDDAIKYAKIVKENVPILKTKEEITQGFSDINLSDVVFGCDITTDNSSVYASWFSMMDCFSDGYAGIGVWRVGYAPLVSRMADDDIRQNWFMTSASMEKIGDGLYVPKDMVKAFTAFMKKEDKQSASKYLMKAPFQAMKFIGDGRENVCDGKFGKWHLGDYIYLRSEEAYFILAEAYAHKKDFTKAKEALTEIMETRQPSYKCELSDYADIVEEINYQKRIEFWGEGIEYLDNRRLNIPVDRTLSPEEGNNHFNPFNKVINQEDLQLRYQIPIKEIENNKLIGPENQNER